MSTLEHKIKINVLSKFISDHSDPDNKKYVFSYEITIKNLSNISTQLISRRWLITDANGKKQEVTGSGVVGEQPVIIPGESYKYSSGAIIETPVGSMQGSYTMHTNEGIQFDAQIPTFTLAIPGILH